MKEFSSHLGRGLLKLQKPDFRQIERQLQRARKDLEAIPHVIEHDPEWALTMAYHAMLRAGRALLFAHGVLPAGVQQHKTVVELTRALLGPDSAALSSQFERLRRKRHHFFYDSDGAGSRTEADRAAKDAAVLLKHIRAAVAERDPQHRMDV